jgi:hypothetical protein
MKKKKPSYKNGYLLLMDYWDYIPNEDKHVIDKVLRTLGL